MCLRVFDCPSPLEQLDGWINSTLPQFLYHAAPLHYVPLILSREALFAKSVLSAEGIAPRAGAVRRDRNLGLADWVHLALRPDTPLLRDKLVKGYPHALFVIDRETVLGLPEVALLPYNTKAWRSRSAYLPVTETLAKTDLLKQQRETTHFPSLEVLVHYGLSMSLVNRIAFASDTELSLVADTLTSCAISCSAPLAIECSLFPLPESYLPTTEMAISDYFAACQLAGKLLSPPAIPFD
jgi:hypothetical protein